MASSPAAGRPNAPRTPRSGGGASHPPSSHNVKLSKSLSYVLRHGAQKEGIPMRKDGYVKVDDLLAHKLFKGYKLRDIQLVVRDNEKKRFTLITESSRGSDTVGADAAPPAPGPAAAKDEEEVLVYLIRANQGHSLEVEDLDLKEITDPAEIPVVIHGTYQKHWSSISKSGLSRMSRNHIHCASGMLGEDGVISGMRGSCNLFIHIDAARAMQAGLRFYRSANGVILTPGNDNGVVPRELFAKAVTDKGADLMAG
ncbi:phosphotransferase KptA/Tpt1 [Hyaloraphidium curvatum]|nr:phosphotransferase KptA/Tpt1 [Hyaloraphidium curvatum]